MEWQVPAKTFLLGEYVALQGYPAIMVTTTPCFKLIQTDVPRLQGIHPESPAGRLWADAAISDVGLYWHDPYDGRGGMGASSAQFVAVYQAIMTLLGRAIQVEDCLGLYRVLTAQGAGTPPSGYDVWAQMGQGCLYLNRHREQSQKYTWPFSEVGFVLIHTEHKLATHEHLQSLVLSKEIESLVAIVALAKEALDTKNSQLFVAAVQAYHQALCSQSWVASHTLTLIAQIQEEIPTLAIKGCGAMGADVILALVAQEKIQDAVHTLRLKGRIVLATSDQIT